MDKKGRVITQGAAIAVTSVVVVVLAIVGLAMTGVLPNIGSTTQEDTYAVEAPVEFDVRDELAVRPHTDLSDTSVEVWKGGVMVESISLDSEGVGKSSTWFESGETYNLLITNDSDGLVDRWIQDWEVPKSSRPQDDTDKLMSTIKTRSEISSVNWDVKDDEAWIDISDSDTINYSSLDENTLNLNMTVSNPDNNTGWADSQSPITGLNWNNVVYIEVDTTADMLAEIDAPSGWSVVDSGTGTEIWYQTLSEESLTRDINSADEVVSEGELDRTLSTDLQSALDVDNSDISLTIGVNNYADATELESTEGDSWGAQKSSVGTFSITLSTA